MTIEYFVNKIGYPKIAEEDSRTDLPGIGEKINLEQNSYRSSKFEVTEVKRNIENNHIEIYVNPIS